MAAPTAITSLTNVAASNGPDGATELPSVLDDYQRAHAALFKRSLSIGASISATATLAVPDDYGYVEVMGSGEIVAIDDSKSWDGREVTLRFSAATTLSHSTNLALPLGQQLVTEAGGFAKFIRRTVGVWECVSYERRSAGPQVFTTLDVRGQASFSASLNAGGPVLAASTLDVRGQASFSASLISGGNLVAAGPSDFRTQASFSATLNAGGPLFARGTFDVSGNASFSASLNVGGPLFVGGRADVKGTASFSATVTAHKLVATTELVASSLSGSAFSFRFISTADASNSATIDFTGLTSTYDEYLLVITNMLAATDNVAAWLRITQDNTNWKAGASDYGWSRDGSSGGGAAVASDDADAQIVMALAINNGQFFSGEVRLFGPANAAGPKIIKWAAGYRAATTAALANVQGSGAYIADNNATTGIRVMTSSGNITSGTFTLYGLRK